MAEPLNGYTSSTESIVENRQKYAKYFSEDSNDNLSMNDFYSLLMAEMSNQDPMEPMSNTEFISQMASFTSLKNQQDALYYSNANYAQSLAGKTVTVAQMAGTQFYTETGVVTSVNFSGGAFEVKVNGNSYPLSNIMEVVSVTTNDGAYASSLIGKKVTVSAMTAAGEVVDEGVVQRIEIKSGEIMVIVNDLAYKLADVVKVEAAAANSAETNDTEKTEEPKNETPETDETNDTSPNEETAPITDTEGGETDTENSEDEINELKELFE